MTTRRDLLTGGSLMLGTSWFGTTWLGSGTASAAGEAFEVQHSEAEWRKLLTPAQFRVLREEGTEKPFSSPLNDEKSSGMFHCAGCDLAVYSSKDKFDSGTGWPSFTAALPDAVRTKTDRSFFFIARTEVHCRRCGGHFGHIFDDGPPPTGKRHCLNGVALSFVAGKATPTG